MIGTAHSNKESSSPSPLGRGPGGGAHILVIRLSAMGDVAMTVPAILALKRKYPKVKITVVTKPHFKAIFDSMAGVTVFPADVKSKHKGIWGLWRLHGELRKHSVTHVADLHNVLRSNVLDALFKANGLPVKKVDKGRHEKKALTRSRNKILSPLTPTITRYAEVFDKLGFNIDLNAKEFLKKHELSKSTANRFGLTSQKAIGIAPFATYPGKMYRLDLMQKVIEKLVAQTNHTILLFGGGQKEVEQLNVLESQFDKRVQSIAGKLSLTEELELISNLSMMLSMDSGNGHLAANYGVPVVTIWGVTHPYAGFVPYNQPKENSLLPNMEKYPLIPTSVYGNKYPEAYKEAINSISPDSIANRVLEVLANLKKPK